MDEDRVYQAGELCFSIYVAPDTDLDFATEEGCTCVYFSVLEDFKNSGYCNDNLGGHNIDNEALRAAGLETCELAESVFELAGAFSEATLFNNLIHAGFIFDKEFDDFMKGQSR